MLLLMLVVCYGVKYSMWTDLFASYYLSERQLSFLLAIYRYNGERISSSLDEEKLLIPAYSKLYISLKKHLLFQTYYCR